MERAQKLKAEREAREKAAREKAAKEQAEKEAARKKAAESQAAKTAKERDAEEKAYYESPVKAAHQREKKGIGQYADTGTGEYKTKPERTASDFAEEIAWREEIDKQVYEDRANGWKANSGTLGAGSRAYAEGVQAEWDEFTNGKHPILLEEMENIKVYKSNNEVSPTDVFMKTDFPNAAMAAMASAPFALAPLGGPIAFAVNQAFTQSMEEEFNPTLVSAGPSESMEVIAYWKDQGVTVTYTATKYSEGGMDITATIMGDEGPLSYRATETYPYNAYRED